jgi:hypothetical protein
MPTIEIASINSTGLGFNQADFDLAIIEEYKLESHRGLFYDLLRQQNGVIVHIGNPDLKDDKEGAFFAGTIVDWSFEPDDIIILENDEKELTYNNGANQQFRFKFLEQYKSDINKLIKTALDSSPIQKVYFLTDYQFGPLTATKETGNSIEDFWDIHHKNGLVCNRLYEISF